MNFALLNREVRRQPFIKRVLKSISLGFHGILWKKARFCVIMSFAVRNASPQSLIRTCIPRCKPLTAYSRFVKCRDTAVPCPYGEAHDRRVYFINVESAVYDVVPADIIEVLIDIN